MTIALHCRMCGREFSKGEQFCSQDGTRLLDEQHELDGKLTSAVSAENNLPEPRERRESIEIDASGPPALAASGDPLVGTTLDNRYRILRVIGEGGMGVVYEALHVLIEKHVAIKVLRDTFTGRADVVERFRQEAKSASKIGHPNIVDVSDFGETPSGQSYIVMEMLIGEDLADVLARERALTPARAVRIAYQIARALHATHKKNIVHRDLKPENIYLVERDGAKDVVKIVDFGVAKMNDMEVRPGRRLTRTGMLFGTPEYMSPEQALGKPFDHRVDIYALGAILFELIAGRVPFIGENFMEILAHHGHSPLPSLRSVNKNVHVSAELEAVMARALAKDPQGRHVSMGAFADDLRSVPEMGAANLSEILAVSEWAGSTGGFAPITVAPPPLPARERPDQTPKPEPIPQDLDDDAVTQPRARMSALLPSSELRKLEMPDVAIDEPREAVLLSPGAELRSNAKLGLGLVVLASALLGVLVLQRSHASLRSLGSVQDDAPALTPGVASEQSTQAATASPAPTVPDAEELDPPPGLIGRSDRGLTARPVLPPGGDADDRDGPGQAKAAHTRSGSEPSPRHAWMTRAEPGLEASVEIRVRTVPRGASVAALGSDARCEPTPCALVVPKDRAVTLRAEARNTSVQKTFTFTEESEVELRLSGARGKVAAAEAASSITPKPAQVPHAPSDLKVPSIFR
ncbi:MAG TPA: protein kinase [Polyangiales bacterium]|nr:protein kinase [Polyangiales bacterium]